MNRLEEVREFMIREFAQAKVTVESVGDMSSVIRYPVGLNELRPGGTVSGPTMMTAADTALYVAILGEIGLVALAVTTSLNFNFLRKPAANKDIIAKCRLIKLGKTLAVGDVEIYSDGNDNMVAHATGTYAIPPKK